MLLLVDNLKEQLRGHVDTRQHSCALQGANACPEMMCSRKEKQVM
jgi:hypothetical protein